MCRAATAASALAIACSCSSGDCASPRRWATSARSRAASAREAAIAGMRRGLRVGAGQSTAIATSAAPEARPQPIRRSGIVEAGLACETGRMKASSSEVEALASTELTTPAKSTANATSAIAAAASQGLREARVPRQTKTAPATASAACACSRSRMGPPKSTSSNIANEPKAAKVASSGLPNTLSPRAKSDGMMIAVRAARRSDRIAGVVRCEPVQRVDHLAVGVYGAFGGGSTYRAHLSSRENPPSETDERASREDILERRLTRARFALGALGMLVAVCVICVGVPSGTGSTTCSGRRGRPSRAARISRA